MTTCPLPVDWLDLLEGRPSRAERAHLAECPSCRAVVTALEATVAREPQLGTLHSPAFLTINERETPVAAGQVRWVAPPAAEVRVPVLVLDVDADELDGGDPDTQGDAVHVAPVWTDRDNATSADLLLDVSDTTVSIPWRVALRRQTMLPPAAIGGEIGELTHSGRDKVASALDGVIAPGDSGPDLESEFDPRMTADEWISDLLVEARHAAKADPVEVAGDLRDSADVVVVDEAEVLLFELKRTAAPPNQQFALAAASIWAGPETLHASLAAAGLSVAGDIRWLGTTDRTDRLVLHVQKAAGLTRPVVLIVHARDRDPIEVPARLDAGADVVLAEDLAISDRDVTGLEMRLT